MDSSTEGGRCSDHALRALLGRRLFSLFGDGHWHVHVRDGHVVLCDRQGDPVDVHLAILAAMAVPGVKTAEVLLRQSCPFH